MHNLTCFLLSAVLLSVQADLLETDHGFTDHFIRLTNEPDFWFDVCPGIGGGYTSVGYIKGSDNTVRFTISRIVNVNDEWVDSWQTGTAPWTYVFTRFDINVGNSITRYDNENYLVSGYVANSGIEEYTSAVVFTVNETTTMPGSTWRSSVQPSVANKSLTLPNGNVIVVGSIGEGIEERIAVWGLEPGVGHFVENWQWDSEDVCPEEYSGERATCCIEVPSNNHQRVLVGGTSTDCGARLIVMSVTGVPHSQRDFVIPGEAVRDIVALPSVGGHDRFVVLLSYPDGIEGTTTQRAALQIVDYDYANEVLSLVGNPVGFTPPFYYEIQYYRAQRLLRIGEGYLIAGVGVDSEYDNAFIFVSQLDSQFQPVEDKSFFGRGRSFNAYQSRFPIGLAIDYVGNRIDCAVASTYRYGYTDGNAYFAYVRNIGETGATPNIADEISSIHADEAIVLSVSGDPQTGYSYSGVGAQGPVSFTVFDLSGRQVYTGDCSTRNGCFEFSFRKEVGSVLFSPGVYFVSITDGRSCCTQKAVVLD